MISNVTPADHHVKYSTFNNIWNQCLPHVRIAKRSDDICAICEKLRKYIMDAVTEDEKLQATRGMRRRNLKRIMTVWKVPMIRISYRMTRNAFVTHLILVKTRVYLTIHVRGSHLCICVYAFLLCRNVALHIWRVKVVFVPGIVASTLNIENLQ